jgi:hypothetical protein
MMLRILLISGLLFGQSAFADFTLAGRSTLTALNMPNQGRETLYVKKHQLRRDVTDRGRSYSHLYDLQKRELVMVDHFLRQADVQQLAPVAAGMQKEMDVRLTPTGRRHALQDWNCEEHELVASLPGEMGKEQVTVRLSGLVWMERKAAERKEIAPFIKAVEAENFFIGAATTGKPANLAAQGVNAAMRQVLAKGMLCAAEIQLKYEGSGPMADLGRRMATKASIVYDTVSDKELEDSVFVIPAGYREIRR